MMSAAKNFTMSERCTYCFNIVLFKFIIELISILRVAYNKFFRYTKDIQFYTW